MIPPGAGGPLVWAGSRRTRQRSGLPSSPLEARRLRLIQLGHPQWVSALERLKTTSLGLTQIMSLRSEALNEVAEA